MTKRKEKETESLAVARIGYRAAQRSLKLANWQMILAVEEGLLVREPKGDFLTEQIERLVADRDSLMAEIDLATPFNMTQGAARLGMSKDRLRQLIDKVKLQPCAIETWKYGDIRLWRGRDLDALVDVAVIDSAERVMSAASKRPAAAAKGAETRRRNVAASAAAMASLDDLAPWTRTGRPAIAWAIALSESAGRALGSFRRFALIGDAGLLSELVADARKDRRRCSDQMVSQWLDQVCVGMPRP